MIPLTALLAALSCPKIQIYNITNVWNDKDKAHLQIAVKRCIEIYPNDPCLVKFFKKEDGVYNALCGKKRDDSI